MSEPTRLLQQFARLPRVGAVKTRLQTALSPEDACAVHCELLLQTATTLLAAELAPAQLWLDQSGQHPTIQQALALGMQGPFLQRGGDLGARMHRALQAAFDAPGDGAVSRTGRGRQVLLVGSDCPGLDDAYLQSAYAALESADLVLGPAEDGGYVLVGLRCPPPAGLFSGILWGTEDVLASTVARAGRLALSLQLLEPRYDIDRPEDLARWRRES